MSADAGCLLCACWMTAALFWSAGNGLLTVHSPSACVPFYAAFLAATRVELHAIKRAILGRKVAGIVSVAPLYLLAPRST